jgi:xanthine dehydrogenase molybdenum-binding subunit
MAAGRALKRELDAGLTLDTLSGRIFADEYRAPATTLEHDTSLPNHFAFAFAAQVVILDERGVVEEIVAAHDVGTAINPMLLQSQLEGSIHMGLGYALTEEFEYRGCVPETFNLRRLGVIRARYMPRITLLDVSSPSTEGPNGARGAGEIGLVPTAAAVAGAVSRFEGRFRRCLPLSKSAASAYAKGHMDQFEI